LSWIHGPKSLVKHINTTVDIPELDIKAAVEFLSNQDDRLAVLKESLRKRYAFMAGKLVGSNLFADVTQTQGMMNN
jgi:hypothetical protein